MTQALETHKSAILDFSRDLIRIASENPPGIYYRECMDRICLEMYRLGLTYRVLETPGDGLCIVADEVTGEQGGSPLVNRETGLCF